MAKTLRFTATTLIACLLTVSAAFAQDYDLVINNGRVMDPETLFDFVANVAVKDGRIVAITKKPITGGKKTDRCHGPCRGAGLRRHALPLAGTARLRHRLARRPDQQHGSRTRLSRDAHRTLVRGARRRHPGQLWLRVQPRAGPPDGDGRENERRHPHETGPMAVMEARKKNGWSLDRATIEQGNEILEIIDKGLQDGAIGVGSTVGYMRDGVTTREMFEVQKVAARYKRLTTAHTRFTPDNDERRKRRRAGTPPQCNGFGCASHRSAFQQPRLAVYARTDFPPSRCGTQCLG